MVILRSIEAREYLTVGFRRRRRCRAAAVIVGGFCCVFFSSFHSRNFDW